jgi:hypothetical protein
MSSTMHPFSEMYDAGSFIIDSHRKFLFLDFAARKRNIFSRPAYCCVSFLVSSYLHCEWATAEKLMQLDKRFQMKIKRFFIKRSTMPFPDEVSVHLIFIPEFYDVNVFYLFLNVYVNS